MVQPLAIQQSNIYMNFVLFLFSPVELDNPHSISGVKFYHHKRNKMVRFSLFGSEIFYLLLSTFHNISRKAFLEL